MASARASETTEAPARVDAGVGVHPLADAQRLLGELVQHAPDRARARRGGVGVAELAEDLRLADDHRVEPRRHREQVLDGRARVVDVDVLGELGQRHAGVARQHGGDVGEAAVERVDDGVDLDAVAGRDAPSPPRRARRAASRSTSLGTSAAGHGGPLQHVDGRAAVGEPHDEHGHDGTPAGRQQRAALIGTAPFSACPLTAARSAPARDVEREDLQLHGEVDLADLDAARHLQHDRREVEDAAHAGRDEPVAHRLRGLRRRGDHADRDAALGAHRRDGPHVLARGCR